jgi:hypothetical protein
MALSSLYAQYFQKSKIFLYPLLDIKKGSSVTPVETYLSWTGNYTSEDAKLIVIYKTRDDEEYKRFEKHILLKHSRLFDFKVIGDTVIAVFDFSDIKEDWDHLVNGKYSKLNAEIKRKVVAYFQDNSANHVYINSYLYPKDYYAIYSELLSVDEELLKSVEELCSKPDLEQELLQLTVQDLENTKILD